MAALGATGSAGGGGGQGQGQGQGMNNLTTLIKRLEAATSRLEDIANSAGSGSESGGVDRNFEHPNGGMLGVGGDGMQHGSRSEPELPGMGSREASTTSPAKAGPQQAKEDLPASIQDMDALLAGAVQAFVDASKDVDALVEEQAQSVAKAFADQRRFLLVSTKAQKPEPQSKPFMDLLADLQHDMSEVGDVKENYRGGTLKEHLAMVAEGIVALQWLIMDTKPADFVGEIAGGAQMYGNRVLKAYKEGDQNHIKYVKSYYALIEALKSYINKHYPSGVTWNSNGTTDALRAYQEADSGPSPATNGVRCAPSASGAPAPPPPPPPPPLPVFDNNAAPSSSSASSTKGAGAGDMGAVFDQLNRGESVTAGLKKVDKSQMTHKNPSLRASGAVPEKDTSDISRSRSPGPEIKPKPPGMRQNSSASQKKEPKKEPKKELDGNKWLIENHDSPSSPIELDVSLTQSILITKCKNTTIILRGKANAISIDNSPKTQILVENLVSSIDVIKCPGFAVQITGALPTIMLDQTDGASIYLSKESLGTEVFTSKCSSVNVVLPPEKEEDDSTECPLPEQIRTVVKDGKLVSEIVEHAG